MQAVHVFHFSTLGIIISYHICVIVCHGNNIESNYRVSKESPATLEGFWHYCNVDERLIFNLTRKLREL